jgi:hypothetical protein
MEIFGIVLMNSDFWVKKVPFVSAGGKLDSSSHKMSKNIIPIALYHCFANILSSNVLLSLKSDKRKNPSSHRNFSETELLSFLFWENSECLGN